MKLSQEDAVLLETLKQMFGSMSETARDLFLCFVMDGDGGDAPPEAAPEISSCPHCGSEDIRKAGTSRGRRRWRCPRCGRTFGAATGTVRHRTWKSVQVWSRYVECMVDKFPLRKCAERCGIALSTAFSWRHKILDAVRSAAERAGGLAGVVEADETFFRVSFKGSRHRPEGFGKARRRGGPASRRGLGREQVCVPCAASHGRESTGRATNLGFPRPRDIGKALGNRIAASSILVTDSSASYTGLPAAMGLAHVRIPGGRRSSGRFNIQTVNLCHSMLKQLANGVFRGVATKYLDNYVAYSGLVCFGRGTWKEKAETLRRLVASERFSERTGDVPRRPALPE